MWLWSDRFEGSDVESPYLLSTNGHATWTVEEDGVLGVQIGYRGIGFAHAGEHLPYAVPAPNILVFHRHG